VSQDEDLLAIAAAWQAAGWEFTGLVFAPQDQGSIGRYIDDLELMAYCYELTEVAGKVAFLPLR
jgi:hypothetical protein